MRRLICSFFLVVSSFLVLGQTKMKGVVISAMDGKPLIDVELKIKGTTHGTVTDINGEFQIEEIPAFPFTLLFSHTSLSPDSLVIESKDQIGQSIVVRMKFRIFSLKELMISRESLTHQHFSRMPYPENRYNIKILTSTELTDPGVFLRNSQNINGIRKGGSQLDPVIRGLKFSQLNVLLNHGQRIEGGCPNRMDPVTAHVFMDDLEEITVSKGPYALKYGPSIGGVIHLVKKSLFNQYDKPFQLNFKKSYETNGKGNREHLSMGGNYSNLYYHLSGNRLEYDDYKAGGGSVVPGGFFKYNFGGSLGYVLKENHIISVSAEGSKGRNVDFPALPMDERTDDTRLLSFDYKASDMGGVVGDVDFKMYHSLVNHVMDNKGRPFSDTVVAVSDIEAVNWGGRLEVAVKTGQANLNLGADFEEVLKDGERKKWMIRQPSLPVKTESLWNEAKIQNFGFFTTYSRCFGGKWELLASGRIDRNASQSGDVFIAYSIQNRDLIYPAEETKKQLLNFSASASITHDISPFTALSLAFGRGVRSPDMTERFIGLLPIGYDDFDYLGNPDLKPEVNHQLDITVKHFKPKWGGIQTNVFYALVSDFILGERIAPSIQQPLSKDVLGVKKFQNAELVTLRGFEFVYFSPSEKNLGIELSAAYTFATIKRAKQYVVNQSGEVTDDRWIENDALTEIPPFEATAKLLYSLFNKKLLARAEVRLVAAQEHTSEAFYEAESPGFVVAGLNLRYEITKTLTIGGGVKNLFEEHYFEHLNRNIIGSTRALYEPGRSFFVNMNFKI